MSSSHKTLDKNSNNSTNNNNNNKKKMAAIIQMNMPYRPRVQLDPVKSTAASKKLNDSLENNQLDEGISSSISNTSDQADTASASFLNMKGKDLKQPGAYIISQRIKNDKSLIRVIDLSDNGIQDEGIMHLAFSLKSCSFLTNLTTKIKQLVMNGTNIGENGSRSIATSLSSNNTLKTLELMSNNVKLTGATALGRALAANSSIEEVNLATNSLGIEGATALAECLKTNKTILTLNLHTNNFNYDSITKISQGLKVNTTLKVLNLSFNNIASGLYDLLNSINSDTSAVESLIIKNVPMPKHLVLVIELIQQRRKFVCEYSAVLFHADNLNNKRHMDEESMVKLARYLSEKRMRLVDMFKVLDKVNSKQMSKDDFARRMKIFEPRLTTKDIQVIAKSFTDKDMIDYSALLEQTNNKGDNRVELTRMRAQLDESEALYLRGKASKKTTNKDQLLIEKGMTSKSLGVEDSHGGLKEQAAHSDGGDSEQSIVRLNKTSSNLKPQPVRSQAMPRLANAAVYKGGAGGRGMARSVSNTNDIVAMEKRDNILRDTVTINENTQNNSASDKLPKIDERNSNSKANKKQL